MDHYYFAYGSNMNPENLSYRGLVYTHVQKGIMRGVKLAFNKLASDRPQCSYANVVYHPSDYVEGVLYQLADERQIAKLDEYETTPIFYSRDYFSIEIEGGAHQSAWVYIANPAVIVDGLLPEARYLFHLLQGKAFLSEAYYQQLLKQPVKEGSLELSKLSADLPESLSWKYCSK